MPRIARFVSSADCQSYLHLLREYAARFDLDVLAYCLMTNHVHVVAAPATDAALARVLRPLHLRCAQRVNRAKGWNGHLWQGRYFASALDETYFWAAIRYVELNPVTAGMVSRAEVYPWSSARDHCAGTSNPVLSTAERWLSLLRTVKDWSAWLAMGESAERVNILRRYASKGLPCGSDEFVEALGRKSGRDLRYRPQGGQVKVDAKRADTVESPELGFQFAQLIENSAEAASERCQAVFDMRWNLGEGPSFE